MVDITYNYVNIPGDVAMRTGLSGNELIIFCLIYGIGQDGISECRSSYEYMASFINAKPEEAESVVERLQNLGLVVIKKDNNGCNVYRCATK